MASAADLTPEAISVQLRKLLQANPKSNEDIFDWIDVSLLKTVVSLSENTSIFFFQTNLGKEGAKEHSFIRTLVDTVTDNCISGKVCSRH